MKKNAGLNNHKMKAEKWKTISPCVKRGLYAFICCREAENWKAIVNSSMWPIPFNSHRTSIVDEKSLE